MSCFLINCCVYMIKQRARNCTAFSWTSRANFKPIGTGVSQHKPRIYCWRFLVMHILLCSGICVQIFLECKLIPQTGCRMRPEWAEVSPIMAVGEWHLKAHIPSCQETFSARLMEGTGTAFGDNVEHLWGDLRKHGHLTKRMIKGSRQDKLTLLVCIATY